MTTWNNKGKMPSQRYPAKKMVNEKKKKKMNN